MKPKYSNPSFSEGVIVALLMAIISNPAIAALSVIFGVALATPVLITALIGTYTVYLILRSSAKVGRLVSSTTAIVVTGLLISLPFDLLATGICLLLLMWLTRAIHYRSGIVDSVFDLTLAGGGAVAAFGALLVTGSVLISVWCFFLIQALHPLIPSFTQSKKVPLDDHQQDFQQAVRTAEAAFRRINKLA